LGFRRAVPMLRSVSAEPATRPPLDPSFTFWLERMRPLVCRAGQVLLPTASWLACLAWLACGDGKTVLQPLNCCLRW
jgi:hypothetical protein